MVHASSWCLAATVAVIGPTLGCATDKGASTSGQADASLGADGPSEERRIRLTLPPLYDEQASESGFGDPVPVKGAKICVARARPWGRAWSDFVSTNGPCEMTELDQPTVLKGVPGVSELVVTVEKDGYWKGVLAVTTDRWDMDTTATAPPSRSFRIRRTDAPWVGVPADIAVSANLGVIEAYAFYCRFFDCRYASGVQMDASPAQGDGPFYHVGGVLDPGATQTSAGGLINTGAQKWEDFNVDGGPMTGATFVNMPENEYQLAVTVPQFETPCRLNGWYGGDAIHGFASKQATIGVPVLAGHVTTSIVAVCRCGLLGDLDLDSGACVESASDAATSD